MKISTYYGIPKGDTRLRWAYKAADTGATSRFKQITSFENEYFKVISAAPQTGKVHPNHPSFPLLQNDDDLRYETADCSFVNLAGGEYEPWMEKS